MATVVCEHSSERINDGRLKSMKMLSLIVSLLLFVTGCSATVTNKISKPLQESSSLSVTQAIARVNDGLFPSEPATVEGTISEGGPAPGRVFPATFQTQVGRQGYTYFVTFTERWKVNNTGHVHYWKYSVRLHRTALVSEGGDFPPQDVK